ncbi:DUF4157 domain-containing protein [Streptomyces sp. NPDC008196]|uniref:eCIS core domain-containing protein n=1 Tax=Streptomyces sp. NPDC008196 TaxID=3364819 RepID=UPI0036E02F63
MGEMKSLRGRAAARAQQFPAIAPPIVHRVLRAPGVPLNAEIRAHLEPHFGHDLGAVRVHDDALAEESARAVNARAYTVGRHVVFGRGEYQADTADGRQLLTHELAHAAQQDGGEAPTGELAVSDPADAEEGAAMSAATGCVPARWGSGTGVRLQRWVNLGTESWEVRGFGSRSMTVWTGTKEEWSSRLDDIDDEDEYWKDLWGFLEVSNDPGIVDRDRPPAYISTDAASVNYRNRIDRPPNDTEKLAFLEALYEKVGDLDLWHGGALEGGAWVILADRDLAQFIQNNQGLYLAVVSRRNQNPVINEAGVTALAEQGGRRVTMAIVMNAGASALKGVDLVIAASRLQGRDREIATLRAQELIRNSGRTIRQALVAHGARVAFEKAVVGFVFDQVWNLIPGGGFIGDVGKALAKAGLQKALDDAMEDSGPAGQITKIRREFITTCHQLVLSGDITADDASIAITGFDAALQ